MKTCYLKAAGVHPTNRRINEVQELLRADISPNLIKQAANSISQSYCIIVKFNYSIYKFKDNLLGQSPYNI